MTREEAERVLGEFRSGRSHSYGEYAAGVRRTLYFDSQRLSFAVREQDASSGDEHSWAVTDAEMLQMLERGFRVDDIL